MSSIHTLDNDERPLLSSIDEPLVPPINHHDRHVQEHGSLHQRTSSQPNQPHELMPSTSDLPPLASLLSAAFDSERERLTVVKEYERAMVVSLITACLVMMLCSGTVYVFRWVLSR
jgi:hypothetical protein